MSQSVAVIQMVSNTTREHNLSQAEKLIALAADQGAGLIVLPENFAYFGGEAKCLEIAEEFGQGPVQDWLAKTAKKYGIWLVGGTIPLRESGMTKAHASCLVYDDKGIQRARYDKIHLFDVTVADGTKHYQESATYLPGQSPVVLDTPFGRLGLAVCYDIRFPELMRDLAAQGAEIIAVPAAFTAVTGKAHWEILLRARAIENLCYVLASAQGGISATRATYGHSMVIDPWGEILNCLAYGPGFVTATLDRAKQQQIRRDFPALSHRRM